MAKVVWISLMVMSASFSFFGLWFIHRKRRVNIPKKWKQIGKIENIVMYPLKSGALRFLEEAKCTETGLMELDNVEKFTFHDRCFLLYDKKLMPLKLVAQKNAVRISVESVDLDTVVFSAPSTLIVFKAYYGSTLEVVDCGDEASKWMSQYLLRTSDGFRLGHYVEILCRRRGAKEILKNDSPKLLSIYQPRDNDSGTLSSLASYMAVCAESIKDINAQLPVEDRFKFGNIRPNIVVSGCEKYAEDKWNWIKIGDEVIMKAFKPCTRCLMVTIDPNTGESNKNLQPFKLLKTYRTIKQLKGHDVEGNSPVLGMYLGLYVPGKIKLGDPVYVDSTKS